VAKKHGCPQQQHSFLAEHQSLSEQRPAFVTAVTAPSLKAFERMFSCLKTKPRPASSLKMIFPFLFTSG